MIEFYLEAYTDESADKVRFMLSELNESDVDQRYHSTHRVSNRDGYLFSIKGTWELYKAFSHKFEELGLSSLAHYEEEVEA